MTSIYLCDRFCFPTLPLFSILGRRWGSCDLLSESNWDFKDGSQVSSLSEMCWALLLRCQHGWPISAVCTHHLWCCSSLASPCKMCLQQGTFFNYCRPGYVQSAAQKLEKVDSLLWKHDCWGETQVVMDSDPLWARTGNRHLPVCILRSSCRIQSLAAEMISILRMHLLFNVKAAFIDTGFTFASNDYGLTLLINS